MAAEFELIEEAVAHTIDGALDAAPELKRRGARVPRGRATPFHAAAAAPRRGASSTACSIATSKLRSSAMPLPAMSNAVP